jgi:excisionase family DNA binding protein
MSYAEARDYSGLSVMSLRKLTTSGRLRACRPTGARKVLLDKEELDALILDSAQQKEAKK